MRLLIYTPFAFVFISVSQVLDLIALCASPFLVSIGEASLLCCHCFAQELQFVKIFS